MHMGDVFEAKDLKSTDDAASTAAEHGDDDVNITRHRLRSAPAKEGQEETLKSCILKRYSCRVFKPDPVPTELLKECLNLAKFAASNSNIQNWRLRIASGAARDNVVGRVKAASRAEDPGVSSFPPEFQPHRDKLVQLIYGLSGYNVLDLEKRDERQAKRMLQYEFFKAPVCAVISMDKRLGLVDAMSVGLFMQTFILALTERGIGSCLQVSVTAFDEQLRKGFGVGDGEVIISGMAIGWPDVRAAVNRVVMPRDDVDDLVVFLE